MRAPAILSIILATIALAGCGGGGQQFINGTSSATDVTLRTGFSYNKHFDATSIVGPAANIGSLTSPQYYLFAFYRSVPLSNPVLVEAAGSKVFHIVVIKLVVPGIRYGKGWSKGKSFRSWDGSTTLSGEQFRDATHDGFEMQLPNRRVLTATHQYFSGFNNALPCSSNDINCICGESDMAKWTAFMRDAIPDHFDRKEAERLLDDAKEKLFISV